jgi:lipoate-protein ligase A
LRPELRDIRRAHAEVLHHLANSLNRAFVGLRSVSQVGTSDLAMTGAAGSSDSPHAGPPPVLRKFSGNSMRARRSHLLYHGTLLYNFDLRLIETCLRLPPRQPDYREQRSHSEFVANLPIDRRTLVDAVNRAWPTRGKLDDLPIARISDLVDDRFSQHRWNFEFP